METTKNKENIEDNKWQETSEGKHFQNQKTREQ